MPTVDKQKGLFEALDEFLKGKFMDKEEFVASWEQVVGIINELKKQNSATVDQMGQTFQTARTTLEEQHQKHMQEMQTMMQGMEGKMDKMMSSMDAKMADMDGKMGEMENLRSLDETRVIEAVRGQIQLPEYKETILDNAEQLADKLDTLEGEARLKSVVELEKRLEDLIERLKETPRRVMTPRYVHTPMVDDFADDTDGSTKAFTLSKAPKSLNTVKCWGSDFPHILTNNNGFTITGKTLTIASDVNAPSTGSYFVCEYYT